MGKDDARLTSITKRFVELYGSAPELWTRAPGRVDLMGSHTDYNLGYVMTMTINRDTWLAASPRDDRRVAIHSMNQEGSAVFSLDNITRDTVAPWTNYVRGVAKALQDDGHMLRGFNGLIHSTVPFGSGLSSSAALEMATAVMFGWVSDFELDPAHMARLGQQAENEFVGVNCGILDQFSSALGQAGSALSLDCRDLSYQIIPVASDLQVVICDTRAERNLAGTEYDDRRAQCEAGVQILRQFDPTIEALRDVSLEQLETHKGTLPEVVARRCRFIVEENQRVLDLAATLQHGNRETLARLFAASYQGARDLYEIGAPAMDHMIEAMRRAPGVVAARQAGAGFGGCMVALVERDQISAFEAAVTQHYTIAAGRKPHIFPVSASARAGRYNS